MNNAYDIVVTIKVRVPKFYVDEVCYSRFNDLPLFPFLRTRKLQNTIQQQSLTNV